jgi:hypothetical protein
MVAVAERVRWAERVSGFLAGHGFWIGCRRPNRPVDAVWITPDIPHSVLPVSLVL